MANGSQCGTAKPPSFAFRIGVPGALIFLATVLAYLPALRGGFIWDDNAHVTKANLQSVDGLRRIWFELGATQQYYPLLHSAFWVEHRIWGDCVGSIFPKHQGPNVGGNPWSRDCQHK